jgi:hypothetical protein
MYAPSLLFCKSAPATLVYSTCIFSFFGVSQLFPYTDYRVRCTPAFTVLYHSAPNIYEDKVLYIVIAHHAIEQLGPSGYVGVKMQ